MKKRRYFAMTLLEIMIVIFIIGLVGSVITVNMRSSLEEGKAFRSLQGSKQIYEVLSLEMARYDLPLQSVASDPALVLKKSGLIKNISKMLNDGWGDKYEICVVGDEIRVTSQKLIKHMRDKGKSDTAISNEAPWMVLPPSSS